MKRFRIVKSEGNFTHYEVQRRYMFLFWLTETFLPFGMSSMEQPIYFDTIEKAEAYIKYEVNYKEKRTVIK